MKAHPYRTMRPWVSKSSLKGEVYIEFVLVRKEPHEIKAHPYRNMHAWISKSQFLSL